MDELEEVRELVDGRAKEGSGKIFMVGYNRRFSPLSDVLKAAVASSPMAMLYRVNAGAIPADSWIQDAEFGGGRILGEVCHFIDFLTFLNGSLPLSVYADVMREPTNMNDTLSIAIRYQNGSIGNIHYFANGSRSVPKEYVEIYQSGLTIMLYDYREITLFSKGKPSRKKLFAQDKGQKKEVQKFIDAIREGKCSPISFQELYNTSVVSFKVNKSLQSGQVINLGL